MTPDDVLYIPPYSHVPFDGTVTSDPKDCYVDESIVTGESTPVAKVKGSKVRASMTFNGAARSEAMSLGNSNVAA